MSNQVLIYIVTSAIKYLECYVMKILLIYIAIQVLVLTHHIFEMFKLNILLKINL